MNISESLIYDDYENHRIHIAIKFKEFLIRTYKYLIDNQLNFLLFKIMIGIIVFEIPFIMAAFSENINELKISIYWLLICLVILIIFFFLLLILKILDIINYPNIKTWNLFNIGRLIDYIISYFLIAALCMNFFELLKYSSFSDILISDYLKGKRLENSIMPIKELIIMNIKSFTSFLNFFLVYKLLNEIIFNGKNFYPKIGIILSLLMISIIIQTDPLLSGENDTYLIYILMIGQLICYLLIVKEKLIEVYLIKKRSIYRHNFYFKTFLLIKESLSLLGLLIILFRLSYKLFYPDPDYLKLVKLLEVIQKSSIEIFLISLSLTYENGNDLIDLVFYPIRKEYFLYIHEKYESYIKIFKYYVYNLGAFD
jgi:hypothetical protein